MPGVGGTPAVPCGQPISPASRRRRKRVINKAKGFRGKRSKIYRFAKDGVRKAQVWAYRDRPVYTYAGDKKPGDTHGGGTGEWRGQRNGLRVFWLRDDYLGGTE